MLYRSLLRLGRPSPPIAPGISTEYGTVTGSTANPLEWADWLRSREAPLFNPNTRRYLLSRYWYGSQGHERLRLELFERWGHCLDITGSSGGYSATAAQAALDDAALSNPATGNGRLTKLALSNPAKYRIGCWLGQKYPSPQEAPTGFLRAANGDLTGKWSPLADVAAMQLAVEQSTASLALYKAAGLQVAIVYHGGESGLSPLYSDPPADYPNDATVVADKGNEDWYAYISKAKGRQVKAFRDRVATLAPERQVYVFYPCDARPYQYSPGQNLNNWDYTYMRAGTDLPSSSNYYGEFNSDLGDPAQRGNPSRQFNTYYDLATNTLSSIIEQTVNYQQPLSYDWVCPLGWYKSDNIYDPGINPQRLSNPLSAAGYMKFACMAGSVGFVDGYFGVDCVPEYSAYPLFDPTDPPPWLINATLIAEAHGRFSWLDRYIFDGDLLTRIDSSPAKALPAHEFPAYQQVGVFFAEDKGVRVVVRKCRDTADYLIFVWVVAGLDRSVWVRGIPGLEPLKIAARTKGSLYSVIVTPPGVQKVVWQDPPIPSLADTPVMRGFTASGTEITIEYYAPRSLTASAVPPLSSFASTAGTIVSVMVRHKTRLLDELILTLATPVDGGTLAFNGVGFTDSELNPVPAFSINLPSLPSLA